MPTYSLIEGLKKQGFEIDYPDRFTNDEKIIAILKEKEKRLYLAIPLLLEQKFSYRKIIEKLSKEKTGKELIKEFNKIILTSSEIFKKEKRDYTLLLKIIKKNKIKNSSWIKEYDYYLEEYQLSKLAIQKRIFERDEFSYRSNIDTMKALNKIFAPAKIRILNQIYNYEKLTPSERSYYYRSIKPIINAISNSNLQSFLEIIKNKKLRTDK